MDYKKALEWLNQQIEGVDSEINCYLDDVNHYETRLDDVSEDDRDYILEAIHSHLAFIKDLEDFKTMLNGISKCVETTRAAEDSKNGIRA